MRILKSLLIWLCFIPVAILNGGFRQYVLDGILGKGALPASGILLSLLILLVARWLLPRIGRLSRPERYAIGTLWATLTVLFEWTFAAMEGYTLPEWLAACNPLTGNLWVLSVLTTFLAPFIVSKKINHFVILQQEKKDKHETETNRGRTSQSDETHIQL